MKLSVVKNLIISMRPRQWIKNLFIFAALIFAREFYDPRKIFLFIEAFIIFCIVSGAVYLLNDIIDLKKDRLHEFKKNRPLAAGKIDTGTVAIAAAMFFIMGIAAAVKLDFYFGVSVISYAVLNILYSIVLKKYIIIDIISIAIGFVIRVAAGALVLHVAISPWLLFCTFFLALFLAINKRINELSGFEVEESGTREVLKFYSKDLLNQMNLIVLTAILIGYALYTFSSIHSKLLMTTIPIVFYGLCRYLFIVGKKNKVDNGPTDDLLGDRVLQATVFLWLAVTITIIWYEK